MPHQFLSDEWLAEAEKLREDAPEPSEAAKNIVINMVVTGGPQGEVQMRMEGGRFEQGLADGAPTKVTLPYDLAKKMFIDGDQAAGMQGFMTGQIKVEGDMSKLMQLQRPGGPTAEEQAFQKRLQDITA